MKSTLFGILFTVPLFVVSQNWSLFNSYDRYNFKEAGAPLITNVLFADSFEVSGTDTLYFSNRIVRTFGQSGDTALKNVPQFLHAIIRRSIDGTYTFYDDTSHDFYVRDTLVIKTQASPGETWLYDAADNITATVASAFVINQFGVMDSAKQINLSNGDSIIFSKSYGLLNFAADTLDGGATNTNYFTLEGIETRRLGDSVINFWDIYNFNVGDEFLYQSIEQNGGPFTNENTWKNRILSKKVYTDSIQYMCEEVGYTHVTSQYNNQPPMSYSDTITFSVYDSVTDLSNAYPGMFLNYVYGVGPSSGILEVGYASYILDTVFHVPCKSEFANYDLVYGNFMGISNGLPVFEQCSLCSGLGLTYLSSQSFEVDETTDLLGYTRNGITYGTMLTDSELVMYATVPGLSSATLRLYPTLVRESTSIYAQGLADFRTLSIMIYDLTGRLAVISKLTGNHTHIDCHNLPAAVYIWRVMDAWENLLGSGKLVKQ